MSTESMLVSDDLSECLIKSLPIDRGEYRGEGNANLVIALSSERKVIRLRKSKGGGTLQPEDIQRVLREVNFIRGIISGFLAGYICVPKILLCDQAEITRLLEKIRLARPEHRRSKEIIVGYATVFPDYAFLPQELSTLSSKPTFCVEIKPKQGFICELDRQFKKCPYCLTQYYKLHTGVVEETSNYCPFDLFSGRTDRMDHALRALLRTPQNNLRIFKDGILKYGDKQSGEEKLNNILANWFGCSDIRLNLEHFLHLVRTALMRPFEARLSENEPIKRPSECELEERRRREAAALEILREMVVPCRLQSDLVIRASELLSRLEKECEFLGDDLPSGSVLERILRMQKLHLCGADAVTWIYTNCSTLLNDELLYADLVDSSPWPAEHSQRDSCTNAEKNSFQHFSLKDCINVIQNYLLFCTAKDCSILMAFQLYNKEMPKKPNSEYIIKLSTNDQLSFLANVRVLDLDMKSLKSIEKHRRRDNDVLQATIEELEKQLKN